MIEFVNAIAASFEPAVFGCLVLGVALGLVVGAIPGLGAAMLIALTLPITFHMGNTTSVALLVGEYVGGISGGLVSAILLNMPGTPASIVTTFDGFQLTRQGRAARALSLGIVASFAGGLISALFLAGLSPFLAKFALRFGPWEYFGLIMMAFVMLAALAEDSLVRGLIGAVLGMAFALPGIDPSAGHQRLTFGIDSLLSGFNVLPVLIGVFAIKQVLIETGRNQPVPELVQNEGSLAFGLKDLRKFTPNILRSSVIGTWVGLLPGIGASVASLLSYGSAKGFSKTPENFGKGEEQGIVASEAANNASVGGALIPLITMGIPGSVVDAILIGALMIHSLQPGPLLFQNSPEVAYGFIGSYMVANFVMLALMWVGVRRIARLAVVPNWVLFPMILVFCAIGAFALNNNWFDVWVMIGFSIIGLVLNFASIPLGPFVIGFVLAPIAEEQLRTALMYSENGLQGVLGRPWALSFLAISALSIIVPPLLRLVKRFRRPVSRA